MTQLTEKELRVLNSISKIRDADVKLGDIMASLIGASCETGSPVNAVNSSVTLGITGVCIDGETFTILNDVYEFLSDSAQSKTSQANIGINIVAKTVAAYGTLTIDTQPTSGDTFTIGAKTYIFVPVGTDNGNGEISIGADLAAAQAAIVAAINGTDDHNTPHPLVFADDFADDASVVTAFIGGAVGDAIATTETFTTATNVFAAVTLGGGTNCSAADAALAVIAAVNGNSSSRVTATAGSGTNVVLTCDVAGVIGNTINVSETMANATFNKGAGAVTVLSGGIDGTVASGMKFMADDDYMYFCPLGNTTADKNWRRVSIGSAY